ncbi:hypothetical protein [Novosphingobium sp. KN65.2]|uniref:hypothetical protein n=1 Tax=Novosphingobium sp. KN65.2 TaxID=1478134 RepID=UPI0005E55655|nr:hypothetical protein [Novosphingobium sp. KN65.2]CDO34030.1 hypothetical protein SPHV1_100064 [Novosphingobium sp. KN65.2]
MPDNRFRFGYGFSAPGDGVPLLAASGETFILVNGKHLTIGNNYLVFSDIHGLVVAKGRKNA